MEEILLLFDASHPCWSRKTLTLEGGDPETLELLKEEELLEKRGELFTLTPRGRQIYRETAATYFLPSLPGEAKNPEREHRRTLLELLLNRSYQGRWGIKEFRPGEPMPYPFPEEEKLWIEENRVFRWLWPEDPLLQTLKSRWPKDEKAAPGRVGAWEAWKREQRREEGCFSLDLLFLHHYDSAHFQHLSSPPGDPQKLFHTDRFYFQLLPSPEELPQKLWEDLGRFELWMTLQRHIFLPWYFDRDTTNYDAANWFFWVTEKEEDMELLFRHVRSRGEELVTPALPLQLFGLSLEALEKNPKKYEYHWDLFEKIAHSLSPAL
ncbi:MAG TPA: hypothetical protein PLA80_12790 [Synergistaceae bacterium]|nr:hypothetical protein [Synergistaceae bacterium]